MKRIKFPLTMKNGAEVRDIESLRENFDMESVVGFFSSGKLEKWLENYYYDDILEKVKELDQKAEDFGSRLAEALGAEWHGDDAEVQQIMKQTELKERLKPLVSEETLERMDYIADTQEILEQLAKQGKSPVYLCGDKFTIRKWMKNIKCIGIQKPTVTLEIIDHTQYLESNIEIFDVAFADKDMERIATDRAEMVLYNNTEIVPYYSLLKTLESYLDSEQK